MAHDVEVAFFSADTTTAATIHAAVVHGQNVNRVAPQVAVQRVSPELGVQIHRVEVEGVRPNRHRPAVRKSPSRP